MSTTVIFSDFGDIDTQVLTHLWENVPDVKLVHITRYTEGAQELVNEAIAKESDTLLFCGHGLPSGLLSPGWGTLLDEGNYRLVHAKRVIGIWCHAAQFAASIGLKGFFSSMFISNTMEAAHNGCYSTNQDKITQEEILFCQRVNQLILDGTPTDQWVKQLKSQADMTNEVVKFNYNGLRYFGF